MTTETHISRYFLGIGDIAAFMENCGIPKEKQEQVKSILNDSEHDFFKVECSNPPTDTQQAQLDNIIQSTANKLAKM
jgi:hypothetical protein